MYNIHMALRLKRGFALDVNQFGTPLGGGLFLMSQFYPSFDYCDAENEKWVRCVGRNRITNELVASTRMEILDEENYECVWAR
jgi:hypothetical protein